MNAVIERANPVTDLGVWIAGHRGRYATSGLVYRAIEWGFVIDAEETRAVDAYEDGEDDFLSDGGDRLDAYDWVVDMADRAEAWLNEHVAPEGHLFAWCDGEFCLWTEAEWDEFGY